MNLVNTLWRHIRAIAPHPNHNSALARRTHRLKKNEHGPHGHNHRRTSKRVRHSHSQPKGKFNA